MLNVFHVTVSLAINADDHTSCYIKHLKAVGLLDDNFSEYDELLADENICNIEELKKNIYRESAMHIRRNTEFGDSTKCILDVLRANKWVDYVMLQKVYSILDGNEKNPKQSGVERFVEKTAENAFLFCFVEKEFGELFDDNIKKDSSSEEDDPVEDYCETKYVVDNELIDTVGHDVVINRNNIDTSKLNCEEVLQRVFGELEEDFIKTLSDEHDDFDFNEQEVQCTLEKYRTRNFGQKLMRLGVLKDLNISEREKADERKSFIYDMYEIIQNIKECE